MFILGWQHSPVFVEAPLVCVKVWMKQELNLQVSYPRAKITWRKATGIIRKEDLRTRKFRLLVKCYELEECNKRISQLICECCVSVWYCIRFCVHLYRYVYMKIHVPSKLAKGVETIKKQTQQTSSHYGLENS